MQREGTHFNDIKTSIFRKKRHFYINFAIFTIAGSYPLDLVIFLIYCRRLISQIYKHRRRLISHKDSRLYDFPI